MLSSKALFWINLTTPAWSTTVILQLQQPARWNYRRGPLRRLLRHFEIPAVASGRVGVTAPANIIGLGDVKSLGLKVSKVQNTDSNSEERVLSSRTADC